ncbi:hypothetical protein B0T18DRAFT_83737 [Schizothecium vesticola]|uniref:Uncharacterized protein n=1 Tax=Schizothecium vesticola TaxID=314040 RepID=A0AA40F6K5_9PEZI|nr:hypothetical protein B0T18DRAFT_83737 [Schizothecium vesticola]
MEKARCGREELANGRSYPRPAPQSTKVCSGEPPPHLAGPCPTPPKSRQCRASGFGGGGGEQVSRLQPLPSSSNSFGDLVRVFAPDNPWPPDRRLSFSLRASPSRSYRPPTRTVRNVRSSITSGHRAIAWCRWLAERGGAAQCRQGLFWAPRVCCPMVP